MGGGGGGVEVLDVLLQIPNYERTNDITKLDITRLLQLSGTVENPFGH